jgi:hypothetical protein
VKKKITVYEVLMSLLTALLVLTPLFGLEIRRFFGLKDSQPPTIQMRQTGNATTTGTNSPAVTGDDNKIEYNQSPPAPDEKTKPQK